MNERVAELRRASHGRLLALLVDRIRDVLLAEEVLAHAYARALVTWPARGIPANAEAWLFTVARNRWIDEVRHRRRLPREPEPWEGAEETEPLPESRLPLLFLCAHPAIAETVRTPLMLQTVLGLEAEAVARVFAVAPAAMAQRLVRAKRKIRDARIPFVVPDALEERLPPVLEAIYGAFAAEHLADAPLPGGDLRHEALDLARLVVGWMPRQPEALGLEALLTFSWARREAQVRDGALVPLDQQDPTLWDADAIAHAGATLARAHRLGRPGRLQIEAAIQAVHCARIRTGRTDWTALVHLFEALVRLWPTLGAWVGRAAVIGRVHGPDEGLRCLDALPAPDFQPAWATRAWLEQERGDHQAARIAYRGAIARTRPGPTRTWLERRLDGITDPACSACDPPAG